MKRLYALVIVGAIACVALTASAALQQYSDELRRKEQITDPDGLVQKSMQAGLDAGCNINNALRSGLAGDSKSFADSLSGAETQLKNVADQLARIAEQGNFSRIALKTPRALPLPWGTLIVIRTGDDILKAIATLAQRSADAIAKIRNGKGTDEDFAEIVANSAVISELILQFYGINTA
jgi:hypothetical protein